MADGWFPRISPSGRHVMRGSVALTVDGVVVSGPGGGISGAWLSDDVALYREHATGQLRRWSPAGDDVVGPVCAWVTAAQGRWAVWAEEGRVPYVLASDGRRWPGFGGGFGPLALAPDGTLVMGEHATGVLHLVAPGARVTTPLAPGRLPRCGGQGVVWEQDARLAYAPFAHPAAIEDLTVPGESCYGPVLIDTPDGEWVLTHTGGERLLLMPRGEHVGYVVARGTTDYPDAVWTPQGIRVAWSTRGVPVETTVALDAPREDLRARDPQWHPPGTLVDTLPFLVPDYTGTLRCPGDGQTLQSVRTGPREVTCVKGAPERIEVWRWDEEAVYLTYDATDGRDGRPWRIAPEPVWCRRLSTVGHSQAYDDTRLVRRTPDNRSTSEPFPVRTTVDAYGEHVEVPGIGRCRVLVTTWEPWWRTSGYVERHWWAIREADGLRLGRVRYEEWRRGVLERSFDFSELLPDVQHTPAPRLAIPDPVETLETPETPERPDMPESQFPPRDQTLAFTAALDALYRDELGRGADTTLHVDLEGVAVWQQEYLRMRVHGASHELAQQQTFRAVRRAAGIEGAPDPQ